MVMGRDRDVSGVGPRWRNCVVMGQHRDVSGVGCRWRNCGDGPRQRC